MKNGTSDASESIPMKRDTVDVPQHVMQPQVLSPADVVALEEVLGTPLTLRIPRHHDLRPRTWRPVGDVVQIACVCGNVSEYAPAPEIDFRCPACGYQIRFLLDGLELT